MLYRLTSLQTSVLPKAVVITTACLLHHATLPLASDVSSCPDSSLSTARHSLSGYVLGNLAKWSQMSLIILVSLRAKSTSRFHLDCSHVTTFALDFLADPDCCFAATSYDVGQKLIRLSLFCIMLDSMVEVL